MDLSKLEQVLMALKSMGTRGAHMGLGAASLGAKGIGKMAAEHPQMAAGLGGAAAGAGLHSLIGSQGDDDDDDDYLAALDKMKKRKMGIE